jgi:hypothetical protein
LRLAFQFALPFILNGFENGVEGRLSAEKEDHSWSPNWSCKDPTAGGAKTERKRILPKTAVIVLQGRIFQYQNKKKYYEIYLIGGSITAVHLESFKTRLRSRKEVRANGGRRGKI